MSDRAAAEVQSFFREGNLTALRELALRLVADHVGEDTVAFRRTEPTARPWKTGNRLLVAVGPSPLSEPLIRWTRRMADELRCSWLAVHVEGSRPLAESAQARLSRNLDTALELAEAGSRDEVVWQLVSQVNRVFRAPVAVNHLTLNRGAGFRVAVK